MSTIISGRKQTDKGCDTGVIVNRLQFYLQLLSSQSISINIVRQFIGQLLYFINATLLNNLILRKDLCHWSKGIQIRYCSNDFLLIYILFLFHMKTSCLRSFCFYRKYQLYTPVNDKSVVPQQVIPPRYNKQTSSPGTIYLK